jgi:hypothetical protein
MCINRTPISETIRGVPREMIYRSAANAGVKVSVKMEVKYGLTGLRATVKRRYTPLRPLRTILQFSVVFPTDFKPRKVAPWSQTFIFDRSAVGGAA